MKKLFRKSGAGFTIIELLVVVAIIAVLAAIVLVNVTGYINQGKNAAIKGNLATVLTNGAVYYDTNGDYTGLCAHVYLTGPKAAIIAAGGTPSEFCAATAWCACSTMKTTSAEVVGSTFCVDSTGYKKVTVATCAARCVTPATGVCLDG